MTAQPGCPSIDAATRLAMVTLLTSALNIERLRDVALVSTGDDIFVKWASRLQPLEPMVRAVIDAMIELGTLHLFLRAMVLAVPHRDDVRDMVAACCPAALAGITDPAPAGAKLSLQHGGAAQAAAPRYAAAPGLERNVRPNLVRVSPGTWVARLEQLETCVCRVEIGGNAAGTGFLVGPQVVLTNYHVIEHALVGGTLTGVSCRFGYQAATDGARPEGEVIPASTCLDSLPYAQWEASLTPSDTLPEATELDFALLRLERPADRGCIVLPAAARIPAPGDPLLILQHADGGPLTLAMDTQAVQAVNANATRIRYFTNTEPGSSGSPCFSMDWDLLALHHLGDPAWFAKYNEGVPIGLIRDRLAASGLTDVLG